VGLYIQRIVFVKGGHLSPITYHPTTLKKQLRWAGLTPITYHLKVKYLFFLNGPEQYHLFKHTIRSLRANGKEVQLFAKQHDELEELLNNAGVPYISSSGKQRKTIKLGRIRGVFRKDVELFEYCKKNKPDMMIGTSTEIAHAGKLLGITSVNFVEDDLSIDRKFGVATYPFTDLILSPVSCDNGKWNKKTIFYHGYHKLAYLHPKRFRRKQQIAEKYVDPGKPFFLLRFENLNILPETSVRGLDQRLVNELIQNLEQRGNVYLYSEDEMPEAFEQYRLKINPDDLHQVLSCAHLVISDNDSMAVDAAILGTPTIRLSDFTGSLGALDELETKYGLSYSIPADKPRQVLATINTLFAIEDLRDTFAKRRMKMLKDKIDVSGFFIWFLLNYPESRTLMRKNPEMEFRFR